MPSSVSVSAAFRPSQAERPAAVTRTGGPGCGTLAEPASAGTPFLAAGRNADLGAGRNAAGDRQDASAAPAAQTPPTSLDTTPLFGRLPDAEPDPLMPLYFAFGLPRLATRCLYPDRIEGTRLMRRAPSRIAEFRETVVTAGPARQTGIARQAL
ncbi:hypothetical protein SUDANB43_00182 [Streptomyces sp. enrichment culture]